MKPLQPIALLTLCFVLFTSMSGYAQAPDDDEIDETDPCGIGAEAYVEAENLQTLDESTLACLFEEELESVDFEDNDSVDERVKEVLEALSNEGDAEKDDSDGNDDDIISEANLYEILYPETVECIVRETAEGNLTDPTTCYRNAQSQSTERVELSLVKAGFKQAYELNWMQRIEPMQLIAKGKQANFSQNLAGGAKSCQKPKC